MLLPAMVLSGIINAGLELAYLTGIYHYAPDERIAHYQAVFATLGGIRGVAAPLLGAFLVQSNVLSMRSVFVISAAMILASYPVQMMGVEYSRKPEVADERV
jgi:MFS family permease